MNLKLHDLEFSYDSKPFLKISDFALNSGSKVFLEGASGSGKTTILEILSGVLNPQKGDYFLGETNIAKLKSNEKDSFRRDQISLIFQNFNLVPYLNVKENILLPFTLGFKSLEPESVMNEKMNLMIRKLGLQDHLNQPVSKLSHGQAQRVAAIRAFLKKPALLLADEPTSALDFAARDAFLELLFSLCEEHKTTLIFVSHDPTLKKFFDQTVQMTDWRVV